MMKKIKFPVVIGFYGFSGSGKTTLITEEIYRLRQRGLKVGIIKITDHDVDFERKGKDTRLFRESGAAASVLSTPSETHFSFSHPSSNMDMVRTIQLTTEVDIVIVEGARDDTIPKIRIGDKPLRKNTIFTYAGNPHVVNNIIDELLKQKGLEK